ncbi:MAG TPA: globin domain-containing protein [Puia sp.]|jgi:hemoglobin-like flavoprotein|nr:globin domain-containing protein [Puia sp.]
MTSRQIELVRYSWARVTAIDEVTFGIGFYNRLFEIAPDIEPMFKRPILEQSRKLTTILDHVIEKLDTLDEIVENIVKLAQRHETYGVKPGHYTLVGEALLWTLERALGDEWDDDLKFAWTMCYVSISTAMLQAMKHIRSRE